MRKFSFQNQVLAGFVTTLFFVFILAVVSFLSIDDLQKNNQQADQTEKLIGLTENIQRQLLNAEASERGFFISNNPVYLEAYNASRDNIESLIADVVVLV